MFIYIEKLNSANKFYLEVKMYKYNHESSKNKGQLVLSDITIFYKAIIDKIICFHIKLVKICQ